jgi:hypothetical protein
MELPGRASPSSITSPSRAYFQGDYEKALEITERSPHHHRRSLLIIVAGSSG